MDDTEKVVSLDKFRPNVERPVESTALFDISKCWVPIPNDESQIEVDSTGRYLLLKMFSPEMKGAAEAAQIAQRIEVLLQSGNFAFEYDDTILKIKLPQRADVFRQVERPILRLAKDNRIEITRYELILSLSLPGERSALRTLVWSNLLYRFAWCLEQNNIRHTVNEDRRRVVDVYYACSLRIRLKQ